MENYYQKWLSQEMVWVKECEKSIRKSNRKYLLIFPAIYAVLFGIIGILKGGVSVMAQNAIIGLIFGIICTPFFLFMLRQTYPFKKHLKSIKREIENVLSDEEKEHFAAQMLEVEGITRQISWVDESQTEYKVTITKDYVLKSSLQYVILVQLKKVKNMISNPTPYPGVLYDKKGTVHQTAFYHMYFFYTADTVPNRKCDKEIHFSTNECREQVLQCIRGVLDLYKPNGFSPDEN